MLFQLFFFFYQKPPYDVRISDWSSDVCSSDLRVADSVCREILRSELRPAGASRNEDGTDTEARARPVGCDAGRYPERGQGTAGSDRIRGCSTEIGRTTCWERGGQDGAV